jgi:N-methylhydantoinase A
MLKVFSTPGDPSQAIVSALEKISVPGPLLLLHGTTVGTNTLLQRKGARVALVTNAGFEDAIEIGRQARPKLYDLFFDRVEPLVARDMRFGIEGRIDCAGGVLEDISQSALEELVARMCTKSPDAIAISLLFSFANPAHEKLLASALESLGVPLSISHQIHPEFREYERTSTVVINAYLQPVMEGYLRRLESKFRANAHTRVFVMQSSGGITSLAHAAREPVRTVLSGPAGGVVGASRMAARSGYGRIISFDMGGTSTDVALVDGELRTSSEGEIAGLPIRVPMLDIHTVGAGGGSLARFDAAGALRVGPESAGADPGPICYGCGTVPTVTDANLLLGRLQPDRFLGGEFTLNLERTRRITGEWLERQRSKLSITQFAAGMLRVVNATMEKAIRVVSIQRGYDPRDFALVAFGGAGGLHACALAEALGIPRVIVPAYPGALSALGILFSDIVKDYSRTLLLRVRDKLPSVRLGKEFAVLQRRAKRELRGERWTGKARFRRSVDLRYRGQGYELNVLYTPRLLKDFAEEHQRRYGYQPSDRDVELVTVRLRATLATKPVPVSSIVTSRAAMQPKAPVFFGARAISTVVYERDEMAIGKRFVGPAIVTEYSATTVVPAGARFWQDEAGSLIVERESRS